MTDEVDRTEETAGYENEAVEAMQTLVEEFGYEESDLLNLVSLALNR